MYFIQLLFRQIRRIYKGDKTFIVMCVFGLDPIQLSAHFLDLLDYKIYKYSYVVTIRDIVILKCSL